MLRFIRCFYGRIDEVRTEEDELADTLLAAYHDDDMRPGESRFLQAPSDTGGWRTSSSRVGTGGSSIPGEVGCRTREAHAGTDRVAAVLQLAYPAHEVPDDGSMMDLRLRELLCDVLHFCDGHGLDFAAEERLARHEYSAGLGIARVL